MKKVAMLLCSFLLFSSSAYTQRTVEKILKEAKLPADYEQWPNRFPVSKTLPDGIKLDWVFYFRTYEDPKTIGPTKPEDTEGLQILKINNKIVYAMYIMGGIGGHGLDGRMEIYALRENGYQVSIADTRSIRYDDDIDFTEELTVELLFKEWSHMFSFDVSNVKLENPMNVSEDDYVKFMENAVISKRPDTPNF